ncbi:MAG: acetyl-CoA carboxylase biotin carboxyl carrier protein [Planctomycetota bacterium]|nr:acetyl-CoA carboxylase biotin carboxyl carrier protein [Planctomycetota bacterium]
MIDIRKLKELVRLMVANDLSEIDLRDSEEQVTIQRPTAWSTPQVTQQAAVAPPPAAPPPSELSAAPEPATAATATAMHDPADLEGLVAIQSPMVGTFYSAASPDADAFVQVGATIAEGEVVCLIEAMKIFNEIKAEAAGTIQKILVSNGDAVEFGQDLFLIKPA